MSVGIWSFFVTTSFVAAPLRARAAPVAVDSDACPALRRSVFGEKLALELETMGSHGTPRDASVRIDCSSSIVRIWVSGAAAPREIPAPEANDPEPERTVAIAVAEALSASGAPLAVPLPARTFGRGVTLAFESGFSPAWPSFGFSSRGWLPAGTNVALQLGVHLDWARETLGSSLVHATTSELELAVAYRPPLPSSVPGSEGRLFVGPALSFVSDASAMSAQKRVWSVTTGVGWSLYGHIGRSIMGISDDVGITWPAALDVNEPPHRSWTDGLMVRFMLFAGFEGGGG